MKRTDGEKQAYNFRRMSQEDRDFYRGILSNLPYDPLLEAFFDDEWHREMRQQRNDYNHIVLSGDFSWDRSAETDPLDALIEKESYQETVRTLKNGLKPRDSIRFDDLFLYEISVTQARENSGLSVSGFGKASSRIRRNAKRNWNRFRVVRTE